MNIEICLGNSHGNFQLHRFIKSENIAKSFRGATFFDSHCTCKIQYATTIRYDSLRHCWLELLVSPCSLFFLSWGIHKLEVGKIIGMESCPFFPSPFFPRSSPFQFSPFLSIPSLCVSVFLSRLVCLCLSAVFFWLTKWEQARPISSLAQLQYCVAEKWPQITALPSNGKIPPKWVLTTQQTLKLLELSSKLFSSATYSITCAQK